MKKILFILVFVLLLSSCKHSYFKLGELKDLEIVNSSSTPIEVEKTSEV